MSTPADDKRFAYGAACTWFGPIQKVGSVGPEKLPCCPHCNGMLFEMETEVEWWNGVKVYEDAGHPGYRELLKWQDKQKRCFRTVTALLESYRAFTGISVNV